jgi:5-methyltetrahydrofolate--homocysteine methyltransferase
MIIIGEKINGFIPAVKKAIEERDADYIKACARSQAEAHADYLDVCAGCAPEQEREVMEWLIGLAQEASDLPLCLDSSDPQVLIDMMPLANRPGILNSVSMEEGKCETVIPAISGTGWGLIALTCDGRGIPDDPHAKLAIARELISRMHEAGIGSERIFIDTLVTSIATKPDSLISFRQALELIRAEFPAVHFTSGLSNISFGMPYRKAINMQFLSLAMSAGMDSAIMDPCSPDMQATLHASAALLGDDEFCMGYLGAWREGLFGR